MAASCSQGTDAIVPRVDRATSGSDSPDAGTCSGYHRGGRRLGLRLGPCTFRRPPQVRHEPRRCACLKHGACSGYEWGQRGPRAARHHQSQATRRWIITDGPSLYRIERSTTPGAVLERLLVPRERKHARDEPPHRPQAGTDTSPSTPTEPSSDPSRKVVRSRRCRRSGRRSTGAAGRRRLDGEQAGAGTSTRRSSHHIALRCIARVTREPASRGMPLLGPSPRPVHNSPRDSPPGNVRARGRTGGIPRHRHRSLDESPAVGTSSKKTG